MTEWEEVQTYLEDALLSHCGQKDLVGQWIADLKSTEEGERLAICIAIDINSKAISADTFAKILDFLIGGDPLEAFASARLNSVIDLMSVPPSAYCQDQCGDSPTYARVLTMADFIKYYAGPSLGYTLSEADEVRAVFIEGPRQTLEEITTVWSGANNRVWVMPLEELQSVLESTSSIEKGTLVNDMLGLGKCIGIGKDNKPEMLYVVYPVGFCDGRCSQPTTLDVGWQGGGYYVSFLEIDSWGRTQSCSGRLPPCRERVHAPIIRLTSDFRIGHVGVSDAPANDRTALLREAYRRFHLSTARS